MRDREKSIRVLIGNLEYMKKEMEEAMRVLREKENYYFPFSIQQEMKDLVKRYEKEIEVFKKML